MTTAIINEFLSRVEKSTDPEYPNCYIFDGIPPGSGYYGSFKSQDAHRAAWELLVGPIPEGLWVLHGCNRPGCISILCLYLGTHQDNMDYMVACGRSKNSDETKANMRESWKNPERRARMSALQTGKSRKHSAETRAMISAARTGRKASDETRAKMSASQKGRKHSAETRARISEVQKGRVASEATKARISAARTGKKASAETRAKMSASQKGRKHSAATLLKRANSMKARTINLMALGG